MNILLYMTLFLIGIIMGSFWQKIIYRKPRNIIQIFYLLLGGITFVVFGKMLEIDANHLQLSAMIIYLFSVLYLSTLIIIAGIDQTHIKIEKDIITNGIIVSIMYIVYLYIIDPSSIYFNILCLAIYIMLLIADTIFLRRYARNSYTIGILMLLNIILIFSEIDIFIYTAIMASIEILIYIVISKIKQKKNGNKKIKFDEIPVGYFISASNIIILFVLALTQIIKI